MTPVQMMMFFFALFFSGAGLYSVKEKHKSLSGLIFSLALVLIVVGGIGPNSIEQFVVKQGKEGSEFSVTRLIPDEAEKQAALKIAQKAETEKISDEPLVKMAEKRRDEEKSASDYLLLATNTWKEKNDDAGFAFAYGGLALLFSDIGANQHAVEQYKKPCGQTF